MKVGIIGAGRQGKRRAMALDKGKGDRVTGVADTQVQAADALAHEWGAQATERWEAIVENSEVEVVIISVPPNLHYPIAMAAIEHRKHVLVEKPLALNVDEGEKLVTTARKNGVFIKCGFNLRFHPGIRDMYRLIKEGVIGDVCFAECRYGIGGRPGYDKEWRAYPEIAGGGELFDRGVHVVDLFRWLMGDFSEVWGAVGKYFWKFTGDMEDNGFGVLYTKEGQIAAFHVSATQWRNTFCLEVCGREGYLILNGLGYVYGTETLIRGQREEEIGPHCEEVIQYIGDDRSWVEEWKEFSSAIHEGREPIGSGKDGLESLRLIQALYKSARLRYPVSVEDEA